MIERFNVTLKNAFAGNSSWLLLCVLCNLCQLCYCTKAENGHRDGANISQVDEGIARKQAGNEVNMQALIESVLNKDPAATLLAREVGPSANPQLQKLAGNPDAKVRRIALYCLSETGGPDAAETFVEALSDDNSQVRGAALEGLFSHPDPVVYEALSRTFDTSTDPYVRQQIPMIIASMQISVNVAALKTRCWKEEDPEVREGCIVALARLNDCEAQAEFVKRLHASRDDDRARYLEYCEYIHASWLLKPLIPILDDKSPIVRIGIGHPDFKEYLRGCDIAVDLIAFISGKTFSFKTGGADHYTDEQIAEVRKAVEEMP